MDSRTVAQLPKQLTGGVSRRTVLRRLGGGGDGGQDLRGVAHRRGHQ